MTLRQLQYYVGKANDRLAAMYSDRGGKGKTGNPFT